MKLLKQFFNVMKFRFGGIKPIAGPLKVTWNITYKCNSCCITCDTWKQKKFEELSTDKCKRIIDEISKEGVLSLSFSGGEPLVRKDIFELVSFAKDKGLSVTINSNGLLVDSRIDELCNSGLDILYVSIDGSNKGTHDKLRGVKGAFEKTLENVRLIKKRNCTKVFFNTTLNKRNVNEIYDIFKLAKDEGVDGITIQPIHNFLGTIFKPEDDLSLKGQDLLLLESQLKRVIKEFKGAFSLMEDYLKQIKTYLTNPKSLYKYRCVAGTFMLEMGPMGEIFPCPVWNRKAGDLRNKSFREIWYGNEMNKLRKDVKDNKHPICWFTCVAPMNIIISQIPFKMYKLLNKKKISYLLIKTGV